MKSLTALAGAGDNGLMAAAAASNSLIRAATIVWLTTGPTAMNRARRRGRTSKSPPPWTTAPIMAGTGAVLGQWGCLGRGEGLTTKVEFGPGVPRGRNS